MLFTSTPNFLSCHTPVCFYLSASASSFGWGRQFQPCRPFYIQTVCCTLSGLMPYQQPWFYLSCFFPLLTSFFILLLFLPSSRNNDYNLSNLCSNHSHHWRIPSHLIYLHACAICKFHSIFSSSLLLLIRLRQRHPGNNPHRLITQMPGASIILHKTASFSIFVPADYTIKRFFRQPLLHRDPAVLALLLIQLFQHISLLIFLC